MKTSQWPHQLSGCASFLLMEGFFFSLFLFPHAFPENLHSSNSFEGNCGSLHSGLCDVVNPRSDLQWNHPESDLQSSPSRWFIASACRPLAVPLLALACLHKLWEADLEWKSSVPGKKRLGGIGSPASHWNSSSAAGKGSCSSTGRAWG